MKHDQHVQNTRIQTCRFYKNEIVCDSAQEIKKAVISIRYIHDIIIRSDERTKVTKIPVPVKYTGCMCNLRVGPLLSSIDMTENIVFSMINDKQNNRSSLLFPRE